MTEIQFEKLDGESGVYRIGDVHPTHVTSVPAKVKSQFAEEHDVEYKNCRAQMVRYYGERYVIVGEINE